MIKKILLIVCIIALLIAPVSAQVVTAKVDDKGLEIRGNGGALTGTLHTPYGWISVSDDDYNNIQINDTIKYETKIPFWVVYWDVEVVK